MAQFDVVRAQVETLLTGRVAAPFVPRLSDEKHVLATGIEGIDASVGGIPRGVITEIVGPRWCSTGRKTLQAQLLATGTKEQFCALVDATDSFDPKSARAAGVNLNHLLWIRCSGRGMETAEQAFKVADILLQAGGGFGLLMLDLAGVSERVVSKIPMSTWFRFRAVVEKLTLPLVVVTPQALLGTCSSLSLHLSCAGIRWSQPGQQSPSHARVVASLNFDVQVAARRLAKKPSQAVRTFSAQRRWV